MSDEIQQVPSAELREDAGEGWERLVDDADIRGISAYRIVLGEQPYWSVEVSLAEFLREEPLESELRRQMATALEAVPGAEVVDEEDRESWFVSGSPSGEALVRAAGQVVDQLAARARAYLDSLGTL
ncbi:MAG TPA: hypothetical protein VIJ82_22160 [Streptosporangiaceae bacterium]